MQVNIESLSNLGRRMKITIPGDKIKKAMLARFQQLTKSANIKGFRKGKVPLNVVQMQYGKAVRAEVLGELMRMMFYEAIQQEKLRPAGVPEVKTITELNAKDNQPIDNFEFEATFEVYPEVTLADVTQIKLEKLIAEITEEDIAKMLETIQKRHAEWKAVRRPSKEGDQVKVDFTGMMEGKKFAGGEGKDVAIELGGGMMLPDFEKHLMGVKAGDNIKFDMTFPKDYHTDVAGKDVTFEVTVHNVLESKLPELNDEFAKKLKIKEGMEGVRKEVRENMEHVLNNSLKDKIKIQVMEELLKATSIEIPKSLVDLEIENLQKSFQQQFGHQSMPDLPVKHFEEQATRRVGLGLILAEIIKQQSFKATPEKIQAKLESLAVTYEKPEELINYYRGNKQLMAQLESVVLEEEVMEYVVSQASVTEKKISYDEAVKPASEKE